MKKQAIKPCPFCASAAEVPARSLFEQRSGITVYVKCLNTNCMAFGPDSRTIAEAIKKWNERRKP